MTSHEGAEASDHCRSPATERRKMRDIRRPTLCVIDENGCEVTDTHFSTGSAHSSMSDVTSSVENLAIRDHNDNVTKNALSIPSENDFDELKATTARLKLSTRRKSTVSWQQEYMQTPTNSLVSSKFDVTKLDNDNDNDNGGFTEERKTRINEALAWLRNELMQMRCEDEVLARKLLSIRHDIQQLKLQRSCQEHAEMLDDVTMDMEETNQLSEICDMPLPGSMIDTPLKQLGVTRMHLSARRFSTC